MQSVAIIGAGPAGLAAARWLKREGFEPVLFEQGEGLGGQWSGDRQCSGVWPSMHVNTCREMTCFSDLAHEQGTPQYPSNQTMLAYFRRYAEKFDLVRRIRLRCRVVSVIPEAPRGWRLRYIDRDSSEREETYPRVVVAAGRFNQPAIPPIPQLESFPGPIAHTFEYTNADRYRGKRVLIAGCAVSALEIACELALSGAARVVTAMRRQRYILQKLVAGVPVDFLIQTRAAAVAQQSLPADDVAAELREFVVRSSGRPERFGALVPDPDIRRAGLTQCQNYLALVAEGRIAVKPWLELVEGPYVDFEDGSSEAFDGIIFGTGFRIHLPFLTEELRTRLAIHTDHIGLYKFTFHPGLPDLAFAGMFQVGGPYLPPIELQARWIAYAWSGARPLPSAEEMEAGITEHSGQGKAHMPSLTVEFARAAGVEPELARWPELSTYLLNGPLLPASFRLQGRDPLLDAPRQIIVTNALAADEGETFWRSVAAKNILFKRSRSCPQQNGLATARA